MKTKIIFSNRDILTDWSSYHRFFAGENSYMYADEKIAEEGDFVYIGDCIKPFYLREVLIEPSPFNHQKTCYLYTVVFISNDPTKFALVSGGPDIYLYDEPNPEELERLGHNWKGMPKMAKDILAGALSINS